VSYIFAAPQFQHRSGFTLFPDHEHALCAYVSSCTNRISKKVFLLGPSHHHYLTKAALSRCTHYATPIGDLVVDRETTAELHATGKFEWMSKSIDEDEHSLEMHLPYIYKALSKYVSANFVQHIV
jgi:AmmeMemoRadiSam system protein B